ncbi:unnamed protein product [Sphenostylis stenocarpa]|uniref:Uncharacterized protein n=1 Tax=Sphenostylis stenocarpa TaxID=92480 RepID=A0AA86VJD3_9FABA|nr:unnamed protein product [Sphenostylis stenocarpa]
MFNYHKNLPSSSPSETFGFFELSSTAPQVLMADVLRPRPASSVPVFRGSKVAFNIVYIQVFNMVIETNPVHALVAFIFFVLLGFLQIRYPENPTPFQLHPKTMWLSIASFLLYCLAFLGRLKFGIRVHHFDTLVHVFSSLSLISLVLLLLPDKWESLGFVLYTLCFIIHVITMFTSRFREMWVKLQQMRGVARPVLPTTSMDLNQLNS